MRSDRNGLDRLAGRRRDHLLQTVLPRFPAVDAGRLSSIGPITGEQFAGRDLGEPAGELARDAQEFHLHGARRGEPRQSAVGIKNDIA